MLSWCNRKHDGRVSERYRFESHREEWALFSLIPSALSFVSDTHKHAHAHYKKSDDPDCMTRYQNTVICKICSLQLLKPKVRLLHAFVCVCVGGGGGGRRKVYLEWKIIEFLHTHPVQV